MSILNDTITCHQLMIRCVINIYELSYLILKNDLAVLDPPPVPSKKQAVSLNIIKIDTEILLEIIKNNPRRLFKKLLLLSELEKIPELKNELLDEPVTKTKPSSPRIKIKRQLIRIKEPLKAVIEGHEAELKYNPNVFTLIGKVWFVKFKAQEWGLFVDKEKYHYIFHMLKIANPETGNLEYSTYNIDLIAKIKGQDFVTKDGEDLKDLDLLESNLGNELSPDDIKTFKDLGYKLLYELIDARKTKDLNKINSKQDQLRKYRSHLLNEHGIKCIVAKNQKDIYFKLLHRSSQEIEKLRQLIKNQIRNAIKDIKECMPMLGRHLRNSMKTKIYKTVYQPEDSIQWYVSTQLPPITS